MRADPPPGVLAYDRDEAVGWAAVAPRADPGLRKNFEAAEFEVAAETTSVLAGFPRVLMRIDLR